MTHTKRGIPVGPSVRRQAFAWVTWPEELPTKPHISGTGGGFKRIAPVAHYLRGGSNHEEASLRYMGGARAGMMLQSASANTILQTVVDQKLRSRVMAFYTMAVLGTQPLGSLLAGAVADRIGAPHTIFGGAIACLLGGAWFALRRKKLAEYVRPIYIERGILPWADGTMEPVDAGRIR